MNISCWAQRRSVSGLTLSSFAISCCFIPWKARTLEQLKAQTPFSGLDAMAKMKEVQQEMIAQRLREISADDGDDAAAGTEAEKS